MKMKITIAMLALLLSAGSAALAQDQSAAAPATPHSRPFQLALVNPIQIVDEQDSVKGLGINLIYGRVQNFTGLELGIFNRVDNEVKGYTGGIVNYVGGEVRGWEDSFVSIARDVTGLQSGLVTYTKQHVEGAQLGFINVNDSITGLDLGLVNYSKDAEGVQIGLVNVTGKLNGVQIGIINVATEKEDFKFLPIVNANW